MPTTVAVALQGDLACRLDQAAVNQDAGVKMWLLAERRAAPVITQCSLPVLSVPPSCTS